MIMNHSRLPLWEAVEKHIQRSRVRLHLPGHGGGPGLPPELKELYPAYAQFDLTELPGLDDLHNPVGAVWEAQELAARLWGADRTYFLVNGSTAGVLAMLLAACAPHETVLIPRNAHLSVYHALILSGAKPVFLPVDACAGGFPLNVTAETIKDAFTRYPKAVAVLVTSPSYWGVCADLSSIARVTRRRGALLLLDEAHGAHLGFHPLFPPGGKEADLRVQSWHKTLGALTPGAVLHQCGYGVEPARLQAALQWVQTSSPAYPILLSLDAARKQMALSGYNLLDEAMAASQMLKDALATAGFSVLERSVVREYGFDLDPLRVTVFCAAGGVNGLQAADLLARDGVDVELARPDHLLLVAGPGFNRAAATVAIDSFRRLPKGPSRFFHLPPYPEPETACRPRDAAFAHAEYVAPKQSRGRIAAGLVVPYPPGVPLLAPGERVTDAVLEYLDVARGAGVVIRGPDTEGRLRVVAHGAGLA